jgi:CheY-like chemotaxis protein
LPKIFERFYNNESKLEKGYGIGLSHCKDIIEAHAGQIEVSSKPGIGTTFTFYIPNEVLPDHKEIEAAQENYFEDFQSSPENLIYDENLSVEHENSKSILIIEDNADMRMYLKNELSQAYIIIEAQDGTEGLEKAETQLPDLILSDIMMPKMDGIELCKKIKTNIKTSHIPVILLTARVDLETKYKGIEIGADDYIAKPFEMEYLFLRIKNILKTREQLRNLFQKNNTLEPSAITVTSLDEKFIVALMEALEKGIPDSNFTVNSLETEMGMSHTNFYRKIKSLTGMSGKEILQNMRMKRAYQLLNDNKDLRVSDVAFMVGYSNPKYFSKCFKEMYGIIPNEFGKQT